MSTDLSYTVEHLPNCDSPSSNDPTCPACIMPYTFTEYDRRMLVEVHKAITELQSAVTDMLPALAGNPLFKMLTRNKG